MLGWSFGLLPRLYNHVVRCPTFQKLLLFVSRPYLIFFRLISSSTRTLALYITKFVYYPTDLFLAQADCSFVPTPTVGTPNLPYLNQSDDYSDFACASLKVGATPARRVSCVLKPVSGSVKLYFIISLPPFQPAIFFFSTTTFPFYFVFCTISRFSVPFFLASR